MGVNNIAFPSNVAKALEDSQQHLNNIMRTIPQIDTSVFDTAERLAQISMPALDISALSTTIETLAQITLSKSDISAITANLQTLAQNELFALDRLNLSDMVSDALSRALDSIPKFDYSLSYLSAYEDVITNCSVETYINCTDEENNAETPVTSTNPDLLEMQADIQTITGSLNWQQAIMASIQKWQTKNPLIARILKQLVLPIIIVILSNIAYSAITTNSANVKEDSSKDAAIVYQIDAHQEITIINECPYYYEIIYQVPENQGVKGWIAKRNVSPLQHPKGSKVD